MISMMKDPCFKEISQGCVDFGNIKVFAKAYACSTMNTIIRLYMPKGWILRGIDFTDNESVTKRYHVYQTLVKEHSYSFNFAIEKTLRECKAVKCSDARWQLTTRQAEVATLDWCDGPFDAETIEGLLMDDICTLPIDAYRTYIKEMDDAYYARCFAMRLCELDGYAGQPIVTGNVIVWGQNPAQNV
jgi:hypothetical protein